jgi:hypothetical protein
MDVSETRFPTATLYRFTSVEAAVIVLVENRIHLPPTVGIGGQAIGKPVKVWHSQAQNTSRHEDSPAFP